MAANEIALRHGTDEAAQETADRLALRAGLEGARIAFHRLADTAEGRGWRERSTSSAWTRGEVLVHLAWALEQLPKEVEAARRGKGMFNMPKWIADPGSYWMIRWQARGSSAAAARKRYDAALGAALEALATVPDRDWTLGAAFYGHGFHTVADLFRVPVQHIAEHRWSE